MVKTHVDIWVISMKVAFKDLPVGARFTYTDSKRVYVCLQNFGDGLITEYQPKPYSGFQSLYSFVEDEYTLDYRVNFLS